MKRMAVIGSGISGLGAAYLLSRSHDVSLFERDSRLGGHTHTVSIDTAAGRQHLDTGFLVHNHRTYPNLVRLFREIGVETRPSDMSFSVSVPSAGFEYSSRGLPGFFAQTRRLASPQHYRLLWQIARFNRLAPQVLDGDAHDGTTLGDYLRDHGFDAQFTDRYLLPMTSAIWSASLAEVHRFPVTTIVRFMHNHGMLAMGTHPTWYVVSGGSSAYIPRLSEKFQGSIYTDARVLSVSRSASKVTLTVANRPSLTFDEVVFACHGDQVLPLLADPSDRERDVFSQFSTTTNETWLHTDRSFLPSSPRARASWNYQIGDRQAAPCVTYHLNRLQGLACDTDYCVTLNPVRPPDASQVILRKTDRHPKMDGAAIAAQRRWYQVSGVQRTHYCGAYWRYGFHEDGFWSAIRVANALGVTW